MPRSVKTTPASADAEDSTHATKPKKTPAAVKAGRLALLGTIVQKR